MENLSCVVEPEGSVNCKMDNELDSLSRHADGQKAWCPTGSPQPIRLTPMERIVGKQFTSAIHAILGPTGTGMTSIGTMLAASEANHQHSIQLRGGIAKPWVFVTASQTPAEVWASALVYSSGSHREAAWSYGFRSDKGSLLDVRPLKSSTVSGSHESSLETISEEAINKLRHGMRVIDIDLDAVNASRGPVELIRDQIEYCNTLENQSVGGIVIDDVGLLVESFHCAKELPGKALSSFYKGFVAVCKSRLALPWNCPVWLLHHIAGGRSDTSIHRLNHVDAMGSRHFGDHLDACVVLSNKDQQTGTFSAKCTKALLEPPTLDPVDLKFESDRWAVAVVERKPSERNRTIVHISDENSSRLESLAGLERSGLLVDGSTSKRSTKSRKRS